MMDFLCVTVRVPKCGSESLSQMLSPAFARVFYLHNTLDFDGRLSALQRHRFRRSLAKNYLKRYRTANVSKVFANIAAEAKDGDLIDGGHIDFMSARDGLKRPLKMITILRDPVERCRSEYNYCREGYFGKLPWQRWDAGTMHKISGTRDFDGYVDFLGEHRAVYGNIASQYIGWDGAENLDAFFARNVFHCGVLEESARYAAGLSEKLGVTLSFPHENPTGKATERSVSAAQRAKIEQIYERDMTLYAWQRDHL